MGGQDLRRVCGFSGADPMGLYMRDYGDNRANVPMIVAVWPFERGCKGLDHLGYNKSSMFNSWSSS